MSGTYSGGCACGQVRYQATGVPISVRACHCRICQKITGQPMWARAMFAAADVTVTGEVRRYATSAALDRGFCPLCGTTLFAFRTAGDAISIVLASMDEPGDLEPTSHIWTSRKLPWMCIPEGVEQFAEGPPA